MSKYELYYYYNQDLIELAWEDHLLLGGSEFDEDFINSETEEHFWQFVQNFVEEAK